MASQLMQKVNMAKRFLNVGNAVDALALLIECEDIIGVTPIKDEIKTKKKKTKLTSNKLTFTARQSLKPCTMNNKSISIGD